MRILHILTNLAVDSGVSSVIMGMYRNITDVDFDFLVLKKYEASYHEEIEKKGGRIYYVGNVLSLKAFFSSLRNIKSFFKNHANEYEAVHLHVPTMSYFTLKYAKKYKIKNRIIHSHSSMTSPNKIKAFINQILMGGKRYASIFWACSSKAAEFLYGEEFLKRNKVEIIKNAVDTEKFHFSERTRCDVREELGLTDKKVITHISNFSPIKNLYFLLPVMERMAKKDKSVVFLFVGDGPTKAEMEKRALRAGLADNVKFIGRQTEIYKFLCASDLLLLPSVKEGLPVTVIEAQACGLPCFVSDTVTHECNVGAAEFLELKPDMWYDKISELCVLSDSERKDLSEKFVSSPYNILNEAKRIESLYLNLL